MRQAHKILSAGNVRTYFQYEKETGIIRRRRAINPTPLGKHLTFSYKDFVTARVIWLWYYGEWPKGFIDHKDGNPSNNRIENLRDVNCSQSSCNRTSSNLYGYKGVTTIGNRWRSSIRIDGKRIFLGSFLTIEEAAEAYRQAALKYHGEYACTETER